MRKWLLLTVVIAASNGVSLLAADRERENAKSFVERAMPDGLDPQDENAFRLALRATAHVLFFDGLDRFEFTFVNDLSPYICPRDRAIIERRRRERFQNIVRNSNAFKEWQAYVDALPADDGVLAFARETILGTTFFDLEGARRTVNCQNLSTLEAQSDAYINFHNSKMWCHLANQFLRGIFWKIYAHAREVLLAKR